MTPHERQMAGKIGLWRFALGRAMIHFGLSMMPQSRARSELYQMFELWGTRVRQAVHRNTKEVS